MGTPKEHPDDGNVKQDPINPAFDKMALDTVVFGVEYIASRMEILGRYEHALELIAAGKADNPITAAQDALGYTP